MNGLLLLYNLKLNCLIFSTGLTISLIIFIRTYTVNYRKALDILPFRINIILLNLSVFFYIASVAIKTDFAQQQLFKKNINMRPKTNLSYHTK